MKLKTFTSTFHLTQMACLFMSFLLFFVAKVRGDNDCPYCGDDCFQYQKQSKWKSGPFDECVQAQVSDCCIKKSHQDLHEKHKKNTEEMDKNFKESADKADKDFEAFKKAKEEERNKIFMIIGLSVLGVVLFLIVVSLVVCYIIYRITKRRRPGQGIGGGAPTAVAQPAQTYTPSTTFGSGNEFTTSQSQIAPSGGVVH